MFENQCAVPEDWEEVNSCEDFEQEQQNREELQQDIDRIREQTENDEDVARKLEEAEQYIEQEQYDQASESLRSAEETAQNTIISTIIYAITIAAIIVVGFLVYRRRKKSKIVSEVDELSNEITRLMAQGHISKEEHLLKTLGKANHAAYRGDYEKANEYILQVKQKIEQKSL